MTTKDFGTMGRLRLRTLLKDRGLDEPLDEHELAIELLELELRLERAEKAISVLEDAARGHGIAMHWPEEECPYL